jgi:hypothetical protein
MTIQVDTISHDEPSENNRIDSSENILKDVTKLVSMNVKLIKLLVDGKIKQSEYKKIFSKNEKTLDDTLKYREFSKERVLEDISNQKAELEEAHSRKDIIDVRKKIGDIDEKEYKLKLKAVLWDINKYEEEIKILEVALEKLENLKIHLNYDVLDDLVELSSQNYKSIENSELTKEAKSSLKKEVKKLFKLVSPS